MTPQEAISTFKEWIERDKAMEYADRYENIEIYKTAIKALEQQPCETIKEIPKDYKYDTETEDFLVYRHMYTGQEIHIEKPAPRYRLEQQPCEDAISREQAVYIASGYCAPQNIADELRKLPSVTPKASEEDILKFYHVETLDDYWIGERLGNMYYAKWDSELQDFVWAYSKYLPWGEHVVAPNTLWKEYTYPSEPKEIPFTEWIKGFLKKYGRRKKANEKSR